MKRKYKMNWKKFIKFITVVTVVVILLLVFFNVILKSSGTYTHDDGIVYVAPFTKITGSATVYMIVGDGDSKTTRKESIELPYTTLSLLGTDIVVENGSITLD